MAAAERHWAQNLRLSHHGATFIATEEGVRTRPYRDSRGIVTTGVGHVITPQHYSITNNDLRHWSFSTPAAAIEFFRDHDVIVYERAVRQALGKASLTQAQYDMCISLAFNIGTGGFASSRVASCIRQGNMRAAGLAFYGWARPAVLWGRRNREACRFLAGRW